MFLVVGAVAFVVATVCLELLTQIGLTPYLAQFPSLALAIVTTWLGNRRWSFRITTAPTLLEFRRYVLASLGGLAINAVVFSTLTYAGVPIISAFAGATIFAMGFNFSFYKLFVFRRKYKENNTEGNDKNNYFLIFLILFGAFGGGIYLASDIMGADGIIVKASSSLIGRDFVNVWTGANILFNGNLEDLYDLVSYAEFQRKIIDPRIGIHNFSYPPHVLLFIFPFALMGYVPALLTWIIVSGGAFVAAAKSYVSGTTVPLWSVIILPASMINIWAGHYGFVIGAMLLAGFAWLSQHPLRAGVLFGLMTIKPHLGVLIPLVLVVRGEWRAFGSATVITLLLVATSGSLFGFELWRQWITDTLGYQNDLITDIDPIKYLYPRMMPTVWVSFRLICGEAVAGILQITIAVTAIAVVLISAWRRISNQDLGLIVATATFLILPYAFNYDMTVVSLAAIVTLARYQRWLSLLERLAITIAFLTPVIVFIFNMQGWPILPLGILGLLAAQYRMATSCVAEPFSPAAPEAAGVGRSV